MRIALLALAGCGRLEFAHLDPDAPTDPDIAEPFACDPTAPFEAPVAIAELNSATELEGTLRLFPDELRGYYWSRRGGGPSVISYVERPTRSAPFTPTPVTLANPTMHEVDPTVTSDGAILVYRASGPGDDLYRAPVISPTELGPPLALTSINAAQIDVQPYFASDDATLLFASTRTGAGDLYASTRAGTSFTGPQLVPGVNSANEEGDPALSADGLALYFRSDRPPSQAFDIWVATRADATLPWSTPSLVANVNSSGDDGPSWLSPDGCRMYISSDRDGTNDVFVARRGR